MLHKQNAPFVVRWRNGVMDDPNPILTWRALVAATALSRYADVKTGHNCFPGAGRCARKMRVSEDTIHRGWAELVKAGWLEVKPLSARRRRTAGALKVLRWPTHPLTAAHSPADSGSTITGNQGSLQDPREEPGGAGTETARCAGCGGPLGYEVDGPADGAMCLRCWNAGR